MTENKKCAPSKNYEDSSCFTLDQLIKMSESFNDAIKNNKINNPKIKIKPIIIKKIKNI